MSKQHWKKHEKVEEKIIEILKKVNVATANVLFYEIKNNGHKISYGSIVRRLEAMEQNKKIKKMKINHQVKFWQLA